MKQPEFKVGDYVLYYRIYYEIVRVEENTGASSSHQPWSYYGVQRCALEGDFGVRLFLPTITSGKNKGKKRKNQKEKRLYGTQIVHAELENLEYVYKHAQERIAGYYQAIEDLKTFSRCLAPAQRILNG